MLLKIELSDQKIFFGCLFRSLRAIYPVALTTAIDQYHWPFLRRRSHVPHAWDYNPPFGLVWQSKSALREAYNSAVAERDTLLALLGSPPVTSTWETQ